MRLQSLPVVALAVAMNACSSTPSSLVPLQSPMGRLVTGPAVSGPIVVPLLRLPVRGPMGWPKGKTAPILFVADLQGSVIRMYDPNTANPSSEGEISDGISGPEGIAVDSKGSLYVSNAGLSKDDITVYSAGSSKPRLTIPGPGFYGLAVDSKGDVFGAYVGGTVIGYRPNSKKPFETIGGFDNPAGIAVDSKNDVWVADDNANKVYEIPAGTKDANPVALAGVNGPVGIAFGSGDTLYVANFNSTNVLVFAAGSKKPSLTITTGISSPTLNGVTAGNDFFQSNQLDDVVGYKKGQKNPFSTIVGNSDPLGIAASPEVKK
jgi:hypothetical protein